MKLNGFVAMIKIMLDKNLIEKKKSLIISIIIIIFYYFIHNMRCFTIVNF